MKSISGKDFAKILERKGWILLRVQGSHHIYGHPDNPHKISVPIHGNKSLKIGLLRHFMKQANVLESDREHLTNVMSKYTQARLR